MLNRAICLVKNRFNAAFRCRLKASECPGLDNGQGPIRFIQEGSPFLSRP